MIQALTAASEPIELEKAWNLVDHMIRTFMPNDLGAASAANIIGALVCMIFVKHGESPDIVAKREARKN